jgi:5-keto 4-deoxyuronate isomerase
MTPVDLEVLLHCHYKTEMLSNAPSYQRAKNRFISAGIIEACGGGCGYTTTERGKVWLSMLLETPYPTASWADPR